MQKKLSRREFLSRGFSGLTTLVVALENPLYQETITISGAGDVTLGYRFDEMFRFISRQGGEEAAHYFPFKNVSNIFKNSDISIVNLEGALTFSNKLRPKKFNFKGNPKFARCLVEGSIDIVNLANNHIMDFYEEGALDTISALDEHKILYTGGGKNLDDAVTPRFIERNGIKVGFLGYAIVGADYPARDNSAGTNKYTLQKSKKELSEAKGESDILVISCHWGIERAPFPTPQQKTIARGFIDSGADIVFAHHPHVIQGIEKYQQGIIFYSLGNFIFGGNTFPSDRDSFVAQVACNKQGIMSFSYIPVITHPKPLIFQPYVPAEKEKKRIEEKIKNRSKLLI